MRKGETGVAAFIAARGLTPAAFAGAAGITRPELADALAGSAAPGVLEKIGRCIVEWDSRHAAQADGSALLQEAGDEIWAGFHDGRRE